MSAQYLDLGFLEGEDDPESTEQLVEDPDEITGWVGGSGGNGGNGENGGPITGPVILPECVTGYVWDGEHCVPIVPGPTPVDGDGGGGTPPTTTTDPGTGGEGGSGPGTLPSWWPAAALGVLILVGTGGG